MTATTPTKIMWWMARRQRIFPVVSPPPYPTMPATCLQYQLHGHHTYVKPFPAHVAILTNRTGPQFPVVFGAQTIAVTTTGCPPKLYAVVVISYLDGTSRWHTGRIRNRNSLFVTVHTSLSRIPASPVMLALLSQTVIHADDIPPLCSCQQRGRVLLSTNVGHPPSTSIPRHSRVL